MFNCKNILDFSRKSVCKLGFVDVEKIDDGEENWWSWWWRWWWLNEEIGRIFFFMDFIKRLRWWTLKERVKKGAEMNVEVE